MGIFSRKDPLLEELNTLISQGGGVFHVSPIEFFLLSNSIPVFPKMGIEELASRYLVWVSSDRCSLLLKFLSEKVVKDKKDLVIGENIAVDTDEETLTYCITFPLYRFANGKDKLVYPQISQLQYLDIKRRHPMVSSSRVLFYREAGDRNTFAITTAGISRFINGKRIEIEWRKLSRVDFDETDHAFHFFDTEHEDPVFSMTEYDLLKWDSNNGIMDTVLTDVAYCCVDDTAEIGTKIDELFGEEKYHEAIELIDLLLDKEKTQLGTYHFMKGASLCNLYHKGEEVSPQDIEEEFSSALELFTEDEKASWVSTLNLYWGGIKESLGETRLAREKYILAMDSPDKSDEKNAREAYTQLIKDNEDSWNHYTESVDYGDRKLIMPVKDLAGCVTEDITAFQIKEIPSCIKFPAGHPALNEIYIGHPYNPSIYVPYKSHEYTFFLDKIDELCYVLQCLGAEEISITSIKGRTYDEVSETTASIKASGDVKALSGSSAVSSNANAARKTTSGQEITQTQRFDPTMKPYLPDGLYWYQFEAQWQRLAQQRISGNMLEYHQVLSTKDTSFISNNEQKSIETSARYLWAKANGGKTSSENLSVDESLETQWRIDVVFRPINQLTSKAEGDTIATLPSSDTKLTEEEQKYKDDVLFYLEDGTIGDFERKSLERKRVKLGISEERAAEIEAECMPSFTEEETEYMAMFREMKEQGEISPRNRKILNHEAEDLGITEERAAELESLCK